MEQIFINGTKSHQKTDGNFCSFTLFVPLLKVIYEGQ